MQSQSTIRNQAQELAKTLSKKYGSSLQQQDPVVEEVFNLVRHNETEFDFNDYATLIAAVIAFIADSRVTKVLNSGPWGTTIKSDSLFDLYNFFNNLHAQDLQTYFDYLHLNRYCGSMNQHELDFYLSKYANIVSESKKIA